jgi:hypothetical protein
MPGLANNPERKKKLTFSLCHDPRPLSRRLVRCAGGRRAPARRRCAALPLRNPGDQTGCGAAAALGQGAAGAAGGGANSALGIDAVLMF